MIERSKIVEAVRAEIRSKMIGKSQLTEMVEVGEALLTESQIQEIETVMITEGVAAGVVKAFTSLTGAGLFSGIGAASGYLIGGLATLLIGSLGFTNVAAIAGAGLGVGVFAFLVGAGGYAGYRFGSQLMSNVPENIRKAKRTVKASTELREAVKARDKIFVKMAQNPEKAEKYTSKVDKLTSDQQKAANALDKAIKNDTLEGYLMLTDAENRAFKELVTVGKAGKLTYIEK